MPDNTDYFNSPPNLNRIRSELPQDTWQHVVFTFNGTDLIHYRNGNQDGTVTTILPTIILPSPYDLSIGCHRMGSGGGGSCIYNFNGCIDEVRVYNRALSGGEVEELYNKGIEEGG